MIKRISLGLLIVALSTSCVSKKIYNDLENKFAELKKENRTLADSNENLTKSKNQLEADKSKLQSEYDKLKAERDKLLADFTASDKNLKTLQASYNALEKDSNEALTANINKNRELLAKLEAKEKEMILYKAKMETMLASPDRSKLLNQERFELKKQIDVINKEIIQMINGNQSKFGKRKEIELAQRQEQIAKNNETYEMRKRELNQFKENSRKREEAKQIQEQSNKDQARIQELEQQLYQLKAQERMEERWDRTIGQAKAQPNASQEPQVSY
jgi:hypothetical protein